MCCLFIHSLQIRPTCSAVYRAHFQSLLSLFSSVIEGFGALCDNRHFTSLKSLPLSPLEPLISPLTVQSKRGQENLCNKQVVPDQSFCLLLTPPLWLLTLSRESISSEASGAGGGDRHWPGGTGDGEGSACHPEPVQALPEEKEVEWLNDYNTKERKKEEKKNKQQKKIFPQIYKITVNDWERVGGWMGGSSRGWNRSGFIVLLCKVSLNTFCMIDWPALRGERKGKGKKVGRGLEFII